MMTAPHTVTPAPRRRMIAAALAVALAAGTLAALAPAPSASAATSYPSWADVTQSKANASAQAAKVTQIKSLISKLEADAFAKQSAAAKAGEAYQTAQTAFDEQTLRQKKLQSQADEAEKTANASETQAGQLAAQLGRSSNNDVTTNLLSHPSSAKDLLYQLGAMSKLSEQADGIYEQATQDRGVAQSLADQADVAKQKLGSLAAAAQQKMADAKAASESANAAVDAQNANKSRLEAQLTLLTSNAKNVEANYNKGVAARAEAARKAAEQAAKAATTPNASGWVRPTSGYQTSAFGYRVDPYTGAYALHAGVDLAPSCGAPIYAAASGTVLLAQNAGGYGNEVVIDNGGGISTAYGHIVNGGFLVSPGQHVNAGQQIARVGSTGWSTGCHLHFETRVGGAATDPVPFMAARGISV